jgi:DNA-binding NarL/FixJ family response regulator
MRLQSLAVALALDAGDLSTARVWLDAHQRWLTWMDATLGQSEAEALEAEWHRTAGDAARARHHAGQARTHATNPRQPLALLAAHRLLGIVDTDAGDYTAAQEHFVAALALADACRAPYERALTLIAHAGLLTITGEHDHAYATIEEARALCLPMDARLALGSVDQAAARLARVDERPLAGLSTREVEVLQLVAAGLTNAQVAERLSVSPRTVNGHLTAIYARLNVSTRAAAIRVALEHGLR